MNEPCFEFENVMILKFEIITSKFEILFICLALRETILTIQLIYRSTNYLLGNFLPFLRVRIILSEPLPRVRVIWPLAYLPLRLRG